MKLRVLFCSAGFFALLAGCVAPDNDAKPWNQPATWENGTPQMLPERR